MEAKKSTEREINYKGDAENFDDAHDKLERALARCRAEHPQAGIVSFHATPVRHMDPDGPYIFRITAVEASES